MIVRRGKAYHLKIKPFGHPIWVRTMAETKQEAREIERAVLIALRVDDFRSLWPEARETCLRIYQNQGWTVPDDLVKKREKPRQELTLWDAAKLFFDYPGIKSAKAKERYTYALGHVIEAWGKERPVKSIKVADVRAYQEGRFQAGASPSTVNWEKATLSKLFQVLIELEHVQVNPVQGIKNLSMKSEQRQVYLAFSDVEKIAGKCPEWFRPILWTAYYTGMRRGEILELTRNRVNLESRLIYLGPVDTKESEWKRVPVHKELIPILEQAFELTSPTSDRVFLFQDKDGVRAPNIEAVKNCWPRALEAINRELTEAQKADKDVKPWPKPWPRFHDLRATWKTNARRSKMHPEIEKAIMGHSEGLKSVHERYGHISDDELIQAIDRMTFKHGNSVVLVAKFGMGAKSGRGSTRVAKSSQKRKGQTFA